MYLRSSGALPAVAASRDNGLRAGYSASVTETDRNMSGETRQRSRCQLRRIPGGSTIASLIPMSPSGEAHSAAACSSVCPCSGFAGCWRSSMPTTKHSGRETGSHLDTHHIQSFGAMSPRPMESRWSAVGIEPLHLDRAVTLESLIINVWIDRIDMVRGKGPILGPLWDH